jgi:hypothetical protein
MRFAGVCVLNLNTTETCQVFDAASLIPANEQIETIDIAPDGRVVFQHSDIYEPNNYISRIFIYDPSTDDINDVTPSDATWTSGVQWFYRPTFLLDN